MTTTPDSANRRPIPLCTPVLGGNAWTYVKECLDSGWVSSVGSYVERFEQTTAERLGAAHAVAVSSGTAALHTALMVADVRRDDEVLVSTLTFIATANAVRYVGARAVPIDAEPNYWQIDAARVEDFCRNECRWNGHWLMRRINGRRVAAIVAADILGHPVDMGPLLEIAERYRLTVVEDAAESLGATYHGRQAGSLAHIGCLSFNGNKLITTGGGGMLVTDRPDWAFRARHITTQAKDDPIEYVHSEVGYNYRLSNLHAALGCAQLELLDDHVAAKRRIAAAYRQELGGVPGLSMQAEAPGARSCAWLPTILVDAAEFGMTARKLSAVLREQGVESRPLWQPMHQSPVHRAADHPACPVADRLYLAGLSLPCSVDLTTQDQARVIDAIHAVAAQVPVAAASSPPA